MINKFFFDKDYNLAVSETSTKDKLKFFLKWEPLINSKVDIVHVHHLHAVPIELLKYLTIKKVKLIVSLRGKELISDTVLDIKRQKFVDKISYFDLVHVISNYMREKAVEKGIDKDKVRMVYRGFDFKSQHSENIKETVKSERQINVICVGRLAWEKGQFYIIDSIYRLKKKGLIVNLDIYGEGVFREFLEYRINQLKLNSQITLKGHVSNSLIKKFYKDYDLAIQPSIYEALSNGLLDLTFHNVPSVVSNKSGMTEIIKDGVNGVVFDVCDPIKLDDAILSCLNLDFLELVTYNKTIYETFSLSSEIKGLTSLYEEVF